MSHAPSLRRSSLAWITILLVVAGVIAAATTYRHSESETATFLDGQLRQIALNAGPSHSAAEAPAALDQDAKDRIAVTIWDRTGIRLHQSYPGLKIPLQPKPGFADMQVGGETWRVYTLYGKVEAVQVAQRESVRDEIARNAALGAALPVLIMIPVLWLAVGLILNRGFRRLDGLTRDLAARSASATEKLPLAQIPAELTALVESVNGLILRLNAAMAGQKRFLADAAHTLRTPLAAMQIEIGNLQAEKPTATQRPRLEALAAGARRASALVDQLLRLARLDEPTPARPSTLDVAPLLLGCVAEMAPLASRKDIDLGASIAHTAMIDAVAEEMRTLFTNLIENALIYTQEGGRVDVLLQWVNGRFAAEIRDTGPGLPEGAEAYIFDRFSRAATVAADGSGLGLAIARRIAERHGFDLEVRNRSDGVRGVVARIMMPAAQT